MGFALITAEEGDGRYTLEFDYGEATRTALIAGLSKQIVGLQQQLIKQQYLVNTLDAKELVARIGLANLVNAIIVATMADPVDKNAVEAAQKAYGEARQAYGKLVATHAADRIRLSTLKSAIADGSKRLTYWETEVVAKETRGAWCTTYTTGATGNVGTLEIPGEPALVLIRPGAPVKNVSEDGTLSARPIMTPGQAYFNVALLPGWQKFKPTYRWATIINIDWNADTANVVLGALTSTAQRLNVNQTETLENVPIVYMNCNARAFSIGDDVVIAFVGMDWSSPTIIGFVSEPRICPPMAPGGTFVYPACVSSLTNVYYSFSEVISGGAPPLTYEITSGALPPGLMFDADTGTITGKPLEVGIWPVSFSVHDKYYDGVNQRYKDLGQIIFSFSKGWSINGANFGVDRVATSIFEELHVETYVIPPDKLGWRCYSTQTIDDTPSDVLHFDAGIIASGLTAPCCPSFTSHTAFSKTAPVPTMLDVTGSSGSGGAMAPVFHTSFNQSGGGPTGVYYTVFFSFSTVVYPNIGPLAPGGPAVPLEDYGDVSPVAGFGGYVNFTMPYGVPL